jgi:hypothetical protein
MLERLSEYDVVWGSPSADASGSMPIGNGRFAANVWVEPSGDLLLLLADGEAWDENSTLLKLGRLRVSLSPNPLTPGAPFRQTLKLATAEVEIVMGGVTLRVWVDAHASELHVAVEGSTPVDVRITAELWRREPYTIKTQTGDLFKNLNGPDPHPTVVTPDTVVTARLPQPDAIAWCHHNGPREPDPYAVNLKLQGLAAMQPAPPHPLRGRTFGALVRGEGFERDGELSLRSTKPATSHRVTVTSLTQHPSTPDAWADAIAAKTSTSERAAHDAWWAAFWERSGLWVLPQTKQLRAETYTVNRGYVLQRYMNACAGKSSTAIKFNGSLFSYGKPDDPDFRRWGGPGFWFQNVRLVYWPMLASGDFDLFEPFAKMYLAQLPLQQHRTRTYYGHAGAHYPETATFWGAEVSGHYGWTPFEQRASPEAECSYVTHYYTCGIELSLMLYTWFEYTLDASIAKTYLLPIADAVVTFYDDHYKRDSTGKVRFEPAQALETWQDATNPLPEIAGLRYLLPKLLALSPDLSTEAQRARWNRLLNELPPIPVGERDGVRRVLPAERFDKLKNTENPELYCVFPFRLLGVGKPDLQLGWNTFAARRHVEFTCWHQDDLQAAYLGLTGTARSFVARRASDASHSDSRFPAFWNAFHDWMPDVDHGGVLQLTLQAMALQCEGEQILLLPAWPDQWDGDFTLRAPHDTVVEASVRSGRVTRLVVTPECRRKDVVVCPPYVLADEPTRPPAST